MRRTCVAVAAAALLAALPHAADAASARQHTAAGSCLLPVFACFDVFVQSDGDGSGTLATSDGAITCTVKAGIGSGSCLYIYEKPWLLNVSRLSFTVTVVATPAIGSSVRYLSVSGAAPESSSVTAGVYTATYRISAVTRVDLSTGGNFHFPIAVTFDQNPYTLGVTRSGNGSGTVTGAPPGISCGTTCTGLMHHGDTVTLTAKADPGSRFANWTGACSGQNATCALTITQGTLVGAVFQGVQTVSVSTSGPGGVKSSPAGIDCGSTCIGRFDTGTKLALTATPDSGAAFKEWTGACAGQGATCNLTVSGALSTRAIFQQKPTPTTTTTTQTTGTSTTTPVSTKAGKPAFVLTARLTGVAVVGRGSGRRLRVSVRVGSRAHAQLQILQGGFERAQELVRLRAGTNTLALPLGASVKPGSYRLVIVIRTAGQQKTVSTIVLVQSH